MEKETYIWSEDGVKVTSTTKVANGVQATTIRLDDGKDFETPEFSESEMLHLFKDTIILALKGRMNKCSRDLVNATERGKRKKNTWLYKTAKGCVNTFNHPSYVAMQQAIKLAENEEFNKFTAAMWNQTIKGLAHVNKKWDIKPYTFDSLFEYALQKYVDAMSELYNK